MRFIAASRIEEQALPVLLMDWKAQSASVAGRIEPCQLESNTPAGVIFCRTCRSRERDGRQRQDQEQIVLCMSHLHLPIPQGRVSPSRVTVDRLSVVTFKATFVP